MFGGSDRAEMCGFEEDKYCEGSSDNSMVGAKVIPVYIVQSAKII